MTIPTEALIESPCIRHCCLNDDDICLGCFRSLAEIKDWQAKSDNEKKTVLDLCQQRREASHTKLHDISNILFD